MKIYFILLFGVVALVPFFVLTLPDMI